MQDFLKNKLHKKMMIGMLIFQEVKVYCNIVINLTN